MRKISALSLVTLLLAGNASAFDMKGSVPVKIKTNHSALNSAQPSEKTVYLMKVKLTPREKKAFSSQPSSKTNFKFSESLPSKADVGMGNVPVLDQGQHGSCVTFAVTGAYDALLNKGDYISQLCNLALGSGIKENSYLPSGWDGSLGPIVLDQIMGYGVINKDTQRSVGCGGKTEYPLTDPDDTGSAMTPAEFHANAEAIRNIYWERVFEPYTRFLNDVDHNYRPDQLLQEVKKNLAVKNEYRDSRLTFAVLLPNSSCPVAACGRYHSEGDSWVITESMRNSLLPFYIGGHQMIITGYDDNAIVVDNEGGTHQGILTLRNSWGADAGDKGNYYMSYEFFKKYVIEVNKITRFDSDDDDDNDDGKKS